MRKLLPLCVVIALSGCQQKVAVPTAQQLIADRALLADYSQLPAARKSTLCSTTQEATISIAQMSAGKKDADFFKANTLRK